MDVVHDATAQLSLAPTNSAALPSTPSWNPHAPMLPLRLLHHGKGKDNDKSKGERKGAKDAEERGERQRL